MTIRHCTALVLGISLGLAPLASAQVGPTEVRGTVRDESGGVLVGVVVTARQVPSGNPATAVSDDRGEFRFTGILSGTYELEAMLPGFRSQRIQVTLATGIPRVVDLTLSVAPLTETVTVTRAEQELAVVPQAVDVVSEGAIQPGQRKVSLAEGLRGIPGLFVSTRGNYSESFGVRLTIRAPQQGVGIGVRGLQMVQDGVPLTVADGTTQPTNIDLGSTGRMEVIRGPSSVLYGNSAGGVVSLFTEFPSSHRLMVEPDIQFGSYGFQRGQLKASGTTGGLGYVMNVSRLQTDGFRQHSRTEATQANVVIRAAASATTDIRGSFNLFDMPFAESPSTLALDDARNAPQSVRPVAIAQGFGESSRQGQGGLTIEHRFAGSQVIRTTGWGMWRDVWNPIPNRIVDLGRTGGGFRSEYGGSVRRGRMPIVWTTGLDASYQRDDSLEFVNAGIGSSGGAQAGELLVDQLEHVLSVGPFAHVSVTPRPRWMLSAGIRYDYFRFEADDRLLTNGDQSGGRTMDAFSPMVGVTYAATPGLNVYGNFATAYQTPTTQELSNRPSGEGGFNPDLEPEDLRSIEGGVRGFVDRWRLRYDVTGYVSTLKNALVQYQRADEQDFYRNAGESSRRGVELLLEWRPAARIAAKLAYTYQRFRFVRFVTDAADYSGNIEPGAPPHQVFAGLTCDTAWGVRSAVDVRWVDAYPVNSANTFENWSSTVVDLRFLWAREWRALNARPYIGIDNLFDARYNGSIVPNAFGNRYYEPSSGREFYGGLSVGLGMK